MNKSDEQLLRIVEEFGLDTNGLEYVQAALEKPSRRVGDHAPRNIAGQYFSSKQGLMVQTESHGKELASILRWEFDASVLAYRCQPPSVEIKRANKNGKTIRHQYTPDFIVVTTGHVFIVEVKSESSLRKLKIKYPDQWRETGDELGSWDYRPASEAFSTLGLSYRVINASLFNKIETQNLKTLLRVRNAGIFVEWALIEKCTSLLNESAWMSLDELKETLCLSDYGEVLSMIEKNCITVDLKKALLTNPASCIAALDLSTLDIYESSHRRYLEHWKKTEVETHVPSKDNTDRVMKRLCYVESGAKDRKSRRYKAKIKDGAKIGLTPLESLLDGRKGNPSSKLKDDVSDFLNCNVESYIANSLRRSLGAAYSEYRVAAQQALPAHKPVTYKTFKAAVDRLDQVKVAKLRMGKRAANASELATAVESRELRSDRPFQKACIDHTPLDILVVVVKANDKNYTARPVLTVLVDDATGYWISFGLSLESPSRRSIALLVRKCVRAYGKLPELLHSDRGAEFQSVYYQSLLAHIGCSVDWSPPAHARYNSQAEQLIKDITQSWVHKRVGNLSKTENYRKFSKGYRPTDTAELTLLELFEEIESYRKNYNEAASPQQYQSREILFNDGLRDWPFSGLDVTYDRRFEIASAVDTKQADYAVSDQGYISKNGFHYQHTSLKNFKLVKKRLEVREDPENPYVLHCLGPDGWITAGTLQAQTFFNKTQVQRHSEAVGLNEGGSVRKQVLTDKNDRIVMLKNETVLAHQEQKFLEKNESDESESQVTYYKNSLDRFLKVREAPVTEYSTSERINNGNTISEDEE